MPYSANPVRPDLGPVVLGYDPSQDGFIANEVLPPWDAPSLEASFQTVGAEVMLQLSQGIEREPHSDFRKVGYGKTKDFYRCEEYGLKGGIDKIDEMTPERFAQEEQRTARRLMRMVNLERERRVAALTINSTDYANGSGYGLNVTAWSGAGTPIGDLFTACEAIKDRIGLWPNRASLTRKQLHELSMNSEVTARLNTSANNPGMLALDLVQSLTGIEKIVLADSPYNTAPGGVAASLSNIWPDSKVLVWYAVTGDDIETPQLGRTFTYDGGLGGGLGTAVEYPITNPRMQEYAFFQTLDEKILNRGGAYVLHNVI